MHYFRDGQLVVLRSTVYPGTTEKIDKQLRSAGLNVDVVFCPERILEGKAIREIYELPQLISAFSARGYERARELFSAFGVEMVELLPMEAELAKLYSNVWRYICFGVANQFFTIGLMSMHLPIAATGLANMLLFLAFLIFRDNFSVFHNRRQKAKRIQQAKAKRAAMAIPASV
jgi:UDP-N-acetyl-D-mannosaminuronate dehydrogenase